jgi:hypothetical protein
MPSVFRAGGNKQLAGNTELARSSVVQRPWFFSGGIGRLAGAPQGLKGNVSLGPLKHYRNIGNRNIPKHRETPMKHCRNTPKQF